jgi:hypothetical protein
MLGTAFHSHLFGRHKRAVHEITGIFDRPFNGLFSDQRSAPARRNGVNIIGFDVVKRLPPVAEISVTTITSRMIFNDVTGEHNILIRHMNNRITCGMRTADVFDIDTTFAQVNRHRVVEGRRRIGQSGDALKTLKQTRKLAVPIFWPRSATIARAVSDMMI